MGQNTGLRIEAHTVWYEAHVGTVTKSQKRINKEGKTCAQGAKIDPSQRVEASFCFISWFEGKQTNKARHPGLYHQERRWGSHMWKRSDQRWTGWWMHWRWVMHVQRKEFTPSGSWAAHEPPRWRTGGQMMDEDVRLQLDHEIRGLNVWWYRVINPRSSSPPVLRFMGGLLISDSPDTYSKTQKSWSFLPISYPSFVLHDAQQLEAGSLLTTHSQRIISSSLLFYKIRHNTGVLVTALSSLARSIMRWVIATFCRNWTAFWFK